MYDVVGRMAHGRDVRLCRVSLAFVKLGLKYEVRGGEVGVREERSSRREGRSIGKTDLYILEKCFGCPSLSADKTMTANSHTGISRKVRMGNLVDPLLLERFYYAKVNDDTFTLQFDLLEKLYVLYAANIKQHLGTF